MPFTIAPSSKTISYYTPRHATNAFRIDILTLPLTSLAFILGLALAIQRSDDYIQEPADLNSVYNNANYSVAELPSHESVAVQYILIGTFVPGFTFLVSLLHIYISAARALHPGYSLGVSLVIFLGWAGLACVNVLTNLWDTWTFPAMARGVPVSTGLLFANWGVVFVVAMVWIVRIAVDARAVELMRRARKARGMVVVKEGSEHELESRGMVSTSTRPDTSHMSTSAGARTTWSERSLDSEQRSLVGFAGAGARMGSGYANEKGLPAYGA